MRIACVVIVSRRGAEFFWDRIDVAALRKDGIPAFAGMTGKGRNDSKDRKDKIELKKDDWTITVINCQIL